MQVQHYCTAALLLASLAHLARAQTPAPAPAIGEASFTVFSRGVDVGREQVSVARSGSEWIITSTGRIGDSTLNRFELKYTADWQPVELRLEATQSGKEGQKTFRLLTSFAVTTAINEITQDGTTASKTDQITARTIVLPNNIFAGYEALAARLAGATPGAELMTYVPPRGEVKVTVKSISNEDIKTPSGVVKTRRFELLVDNVGATFTVTLTVDDLLPARQAGSPERQPHRRAQRHRRRRGAIAVGAQSDRLRRHDSGQRLQHRRHDHDPAGHGTAEAADDRAGRRFRCGRSRQHGRRHPDHEPARGGAVAAGLLRVALRQARHRPERRAHGIGVAARLRRRSHQRHQMAGAARRCGPAADRGGWSQRRRGGCAAGGGAGEEDRVPRADGHQRHERRGARARAAAARAGSSEAPRHREGGEGRPAEEDSDRP